MEFATIIMTIVGTIGALLGTAHLWRDAPPEPVPMVVPPALPASVVNDCTCPAGRGYRHRHAPATSVV